MKNSIYIALILGMCMISMAGMQAQGLWQISVGTQQSNEFFGGELKSNMGVEYQRDWGKRFVYGVGAYATDVPLSAMLRSSFTNAEFVSPARISQGICGFGCCGLFFPEPGSFETVTNSRVRLEMPVFLGLKLGKHTHLPVMLKLGINNQFAYKRTSLDDEVIARGVSYAPGAHLGLQIPVFRNNSFGISLEPYMSYIRVIPSNDLPQFFCGTPTVMNMGNAGIRLTTSIF